MNEAKIKALKWTGKDKRIPLGDGLYLQVRKSSKTYLIRKQGEGGGLKTLKPTSPTMTLKQARFKALDAKMSGEVSSVTVRDLVEKYRSEIVIPESKVPKQVETYLRNIENEFGKRKLMDINRSMLVNYIQRYAKRGERSADRMRSYLNQILGYGVELGWLDRNPMTEVSRRVTGYRPIARSRVLSSDEIKAVWSWSHPNARVIRFLLLTGLRISEAQKGYRENTRWIVPEALSKNGKAHWVHLTPTAIKQLPLPACTQTNVQSWLRRKLGDVDRYTPHDCRRTFTTIGNDNGAMPHVMEKCLNHTMEGTMAVYNHAEYEAERIEAAKTVEKAILLDI